MNTPTISAVLPSTVHSGRAHGGHADATFSSVLRRQHAAEPRAGGAASARPGAAHPEKAQGEVQTPADSAHGASASGKQATGKEAASQTTDADTDNSADVAATGLNLPQIALTIAAEVAAVQDTAAHGAAAAGDSAAAAGRRIKGTHAYSPTLDALENIAVDKHSATGQGATNTRGLATTDSTTLVDVAMGYKAAATGAGDTAPASVASLRPALAQGKAASLAGAHQAILTMQARMQASENGKMKLVPMPDFVVAGDPRVSGGAHGMGAEAGQPLGLTDASAGMASASAGAHIPASLSPMPLGGGNAGALLASPAIAAPLQSPQWGAEFGRQFLSIVQSGEGGASQTAELRLDPPELGPLRISINIQDKVANAIFISPHASVRQTVENALPQLQQLLAQSGLSLGQASVSDHGQAGQGFGDPSEANGQRSAGAESAGAGGVTEAVAAAPRARVAAPDALVDTFA